MSPFLHVGGSRTRLGIVVVGSCGSVWYRTSFCCCCHISHTFTVTWSLCTYWAVCCCRSIRLNASLLVVVFTWSSTTLTGNECFLMSVLAYWAASPCAAAACLVLTLFLIPGTGISMGACWPSLTSLWTNARSSFFLLCSKVSSPSSWHLSF